MKKLLIVILILFLAPFMSAQGWYWNPFIQRLDYYEPISSYNLGDLGDAVFTLSANGNLIYYNGTNWVNLATGTNGQILQLVAGIPAWITAITPDHGGTGLITYTIGDLIYADGATSLARLADVAVNQVLVSGGIGVAPAYSASPTLSGATFTGVVTGVIPTAETHFAIKEYVDESIGDTLEYHFNNTVSNIDEETETTYNMVDIVYAGEENITRTTITAAPLQLLYCFATLSGQPGGLDLSKGTYDSHLHLEVTGVGARSVDVHWTLSSIDNDGTNESLIMTSETEVGVSGGEAGYTIHAFLASDVTLGAASRLLFKLYGDGNAGGDATMEFHVEGDTGTHLSIKVSSTIFNTIYVRQDGTTALTGAWDMGNQALTNVNIDSGVVEITSITVLDKIIETVEAHGNVGSGTEDFDLDDGSYHTVTATGDFIVTFSSWPSGGLVSSITIKLINAGAYTITWPGTVNWPGGVEPAWTAAGTDFVLFWTDDNGTIVYGTRSVQDIK